jgi:signal transduction histidine kinase
MEWIQSLVISLLKLARIDAGQVKLKKEDMDLQNLVKDSVDKLAVIMDLKNVSVEIEPVKKVNDKGIPIPDPIVKGDYNWQLEAVTNIIKNSIEHSPNGGKVYVSIEPTSVYNRIVIRDEGEGISEKDIKHIFDRFYKAENSGPDSVGIGLSLSKSIIEAGGGYITVDSKKGKGTSFSVTYVRE